MVINRLFYIRNLLKANFGAMKKTAILLTLIVCVSGTAFSQTAEDSIKTTIDRMFNAMKNSDANDFLSCFGDSAILQTIARDKNGHSIIKSEGLLDFAMLVGRMPKGMADERIAYEQVKVNGPLAMVWTPYQFYLNGKFSHCGVNSFQLVRFNGGWKIQYLIDTRSKEGCQ